jgi:molybdopterin/thiamine biosynthesis adenylyltransferase
VSSPTRPGTTVPDGSHGSGAPLTDEQLLRYSRQIFLPDVDETGQQRLAAARVLVLGLGGLGSPVATYLAGAGVGRLVLVDPDEVDVSNLHRQILHRSTTIGLAKTGSARLTLEALNPDVEIVTHEHRLSGAELLDVLGGVDLVVDGTDNFESRFELNRACVALGKPLVYGAVVGMEGQASVFRADRDDSPCYACLYPGFDEQAEAARPTSNWENCSGQGVLGPVAGIVGCIQATEALKVLLGIETGLAGRLLLIDARTMEFSWFQLSRNPHCKACGKPGKTPRSGG